MRSEKRVGLRVGSKSVLCQLTAWGKWYNPWEKKKKTNQKNRTEI